MTDPPAAPAAPARTPMQTSAQAPPQAPVRTRVRIGHGDVRFARAPVLVGHYSGDGILSAEAALDHALHGRLSHCARLGLYPGPVETCQVFLDHGAWAGTPGAVVMGLGEVGHLTVGQLTRAVAHAVLTLSLRDDPGGERSADPAAGATTTATTATDAGTTNGAGTADGAGPRGPVALTTLLIGSGAGGLSVAESVQGILDGVRRANERLRAAGSPAQVGGLEILEIWQDRALLAVRALQDAVGTSPLRGLFDAETQLRVGRGGRRRPVFSEPPGWWQRLHIDGQDDGSLAFESPTRLAGTAVRTVATQRLLVDRLVAAMVDSPSPDVASARTLFELLVPAELKDQAPTLEDVVLVLDKASAAYPWELLQGASTGELGRPVGLDRGVIRQLTSDSFRTRVLAATGTQALVIGDTDSGLAPLTGAQNEAREVETALQEATFTCTTLIRGTGTRVVQALFARPYRVIHIAAHGVRDLPVGSADGPGGPDPAGTVTGVVLGGGMYLTAAEISQLSQAPDLVFVNCCHLGVVDERPGPRLVPPSASAPEPPGSAPRNVRRDYHKLAASLATELIDAGVRAVVVAGWAVDDRAAATFATTLYRRLLAGVAFGDAVTEARGETWERHRRVNTWGAYQCYGDPDFRLAQPVPTARTRSGGSHACVEEAMASIDNITQSMTVARTSDRGLAALAHFEADDGKEWLDDPQVQVRLAHAYAEGGQLPTALDWFDRAGRGDPSSLTLQDLEVRADLQIQVIAGDALAGRTPPAEAAARIDAAISTLTALLADPLLAMAGAVGPVDLDALGEASGADLDRLWRLGLAYQRRAHVTTTGRVEALTAMAACFRAARTAPTRPPDRPRAGVVAQVARAELALGWIRATEPPDALPPALIEETLRDARAVADAAPTFWRRTVCVDLQILAALRDRRTDAGTVRRLADDYRRAARLGSAREQRLLAEGLDFLVEMSTPAPAAHALLSVLRRDPSGAESTDPATRPLGQPCGPAALSGRPRVASHPVSGAEPGVGAAPSSEPGGRGCETARRHHT